MEKDDFLQGKGIDPDGQRLEEAIVGPPPPGKNVTQSTRGGNVYSKKTRLVSTTRENSSGIHAAAINHHSIYLASYVHLYKKNGEGMQPTALHFPSLLRPDTAVGRFRETHDICSDVQFPTLSILTVFTCLSLPPHVEFPRYNNIVAPFPQSQNPHQKPKTRVIKLRRCFNSLVASATRAHVSVPSDEHFPPMAAPPRSHAHELIRMTVFFQRFRVLPGTNTKTPDRTTCSSTCWVETGKRTSP